MAVSKEQFPKRVVAAVSIAALIISILLIIVQAMYVLLMIFAGVLLAIMLTGLSNIIQKFIKIPPKISLSIVIAALILIIALTGLILGPGIVDGIKNLQSKMPQAMEQLKLNIESFGWGEEAINNINKKFDELLSDPNIISRIMGIFSSTVGVIGSLVLIIVTGLYFAFDPDLYINGIIRLVPKKGRPHAKEILLSLGNGLKWWIVGQFSSMTIIGVLTLIGLWILGIPLAFTLALIAFSFSFVPTIGPIASAVPAVLIGLMQSPAKALYVILLYIGVQTIESYLLTPMIQQKTVSMPPALLISTQILVGVFLGIFGLLLATPLMVVIIILVQKLYVDDALGDDVKALGE